MKKQIVVLLLLITMSNLSFSEEPETFYRNDVTASQQAYLQQLQSNEKHLLELIKTTKDLSKKANALASLGALYSVNKEFLKAEHFLKLVSDSNQYEKDNKDVSAARYTLAMLYIHGKGKIKKDFNKAFHYFSKAAFVGNSEAMREVYVMCRDKEVSASRIRNFTKENYNIYIQGENNPDYLNALRNLQVLYQCKSEGDYIKSLEN